MADGTVSRDEHDLVPDRPRAPDGTNGDGLDDLTTTDTGRRRALRPIMFRLHFFGGFFAAPIALWLAVTGILFAWNPQIESMVYGDQKDAPAEGEMSPTADQLDAVTAAHPGHKVLEVTPSDQAGESTAVLLEPPDAGPAAEFGPAEGAFTAYVDPVSTEVSGTIDEANRPDEWIRNLHSNFRLGTTAGTVTELAASWVLVSLATGLYLWWPRNRRALRSSVRLRLRELGSGRRAWRDLHSTLGVVLFGALVLMVATGLTWTEYAGQWVDVTKDAVSSEAPTLQTDLTGSGGGTGGGTGEAAPPPELGDIDQVTTAAVQAGAEHPFTVTPPSDATQAWTVAEIDDLWPVQPATFAVDPGTGEVVDRLDFSDQPLLDQATTIGIDFHQAQLLGPFNQVLLTVVALALMGLLASGYVMWWRRRPAGAFGPPPKMGSLVRDVPWPVWAGFAVLMVLLPTMGVTFLLFLLVERAVWGVRRARAATVGGQLHDDAAQR